MVEGERKSVGWEGLKYVAIGETLSVEIGMYVASFSPLQPYRLSNLHNHCTCQANGCKDEVELYYEGTRINSTRIDI